ncbi:MAG: MFS transporter [Candidatus Bathyarchaeia archaeon]
MKKENTTEVTSRRNIFALGFVSFFTDVSSEMVFSILPAFLLSLPGGSRAVLGLVEGTAEALSYTLRAISGVFSDKIRKRKLLVLVGYSISNVAKPFFALAKAPLEVLIIRVSDRVGKAVRTSPRDVLLSESASERHRGAAFGLHRTLDQAGAIIGPIAASLLMITLGFTMQEVFWFSLIPGTVALLLLVFFVKEKTSKLQGDFKLLAGVRSVLKGKFAWLLVIVGFFSLGAFNFSFVLLNAQQAGIANSFIPLVYAVVNLAHTVTAIPAGVLSDRVGKEKVMLLGFSLFLCSAFLILVLPVNGFNALVVATVYGVYFGIVETTQRALIPEYVDANLKGTAYGIYYFVVGLAFFASNAIVGSLWEYFGSTIAAAYSAIVSLLAVIMLTVFVRRNK